MRDPPMNAVKEAFRRARYRQMQARSLQDRYPTASMPEGPERRIPRFTPTTSFDLVTDFLRAPRFMADFSKR